MNQPDPPTAVDVDSPSSSEPSIGGATPLERIRDSVAERVLGQQRAIENLLVTYLAGGHCLLEGVPGIGKTRLANSFASALGLKMKRVQFTPDLMPADITGSSVFDARDGDFRLVRGPLFTQVLLADEINRTPPKTQAALLEAMQEHQVSIDGETHELDSAFFVIATQNPIDFEGTYPLPEAQADRFLLRIDMGLPAAADELRLLELALETDLLDVRAAPPEPVISAERARALRGSALDTHVAKAVLDYLQRLAAAVRSAPEVELGPSPRAALCLLRAAQSRAVVLGRDFVLPDDLQDLLLPCWGHRTRLRAEAELEGVTPASLLDSISASVDVPHSDSLARPEPGGTEEPAGE